jgi:hypothetical protein
MVPLMNASIVGSPYFVHAPGCGYLDKILENMGYNVDPEIKTSLTFFFMKKAKEHTIVFVQKYDVYFLVLIVAIIILVAIK